MNQRSTRRTVYFIKPIGMAGPVKIGCSASPNVRRVALDTWSPFPLEIIAQIDGDFELERRFHAMFVDTHQRREWFATSPAMVAVIALINAGRFDIASLPAPMSIACRIAGGKRERPEWFSRQQSLSLRAGYMGRRTGYRCPVSTYDVVRCNNVEAIAVIEAYLADPLRHGLPIEAPWARLAASKFAERTLAA